MEENFSPDEKITLSKLYVDLNDDKPLAAQLAEQITWLIASGQLVEGELLPSIRLFAKHLHINQHTVRAAYQKLASRGLITTRQGAGSFVNRFDSKSLEANPKRLLSHTIGVIIPALSNPFFSTLIAGIEDYASRNHILITIGHTQNMRRMEHEYVDMLIAKKADGLILAPSGLQFSNKEDRRDSTLQGYPIPVVYVDRPDESGYVVLIDAEGAGFKATEHLIEHGFKRIAVITGAVRLPTLQECYAGYQRALLEYNLSFDPNLTVEVERFDYKSGYWAAKKLLTLKHSPRAIFISGDVLAIGAMRAIRESGMRVPEDVSIVGYNNIDTAAYLEPPLTTVDVPAYQLGNTSMRLLHQLILGESDHDLITTLPTSLIIRNSCGC